MTKEKIFNLPNLISFYRLASFPFILLLAYSGREHWFAIFFSINLITDIADGLIARAFKLSTQFGARLDSMADITTYLTAFYGIFKFKWPDLAPHSALLFTAIAVYLLTFVVGLLRFGKYPSLHLYSCKLAAYLQGLFFFVLFVWGFQLWLFRLALLWGIASWLEEITVLMIAKEMKSNARGLYWFLKNR